MLIYDHFSKKCYVIFKNFLLLFWKFLGYIVWVPCFTSINSSWWLFDWDNFTPASCKWLQGQNMLVGLRLIEITEPSDTLNYKPFFKYWILQTILHVFLLFVFCGTKYFVLKTELHFTFFWFDLGWHSVLQYYRLCVSDAVFIRL